MSKHPTATPTQRQQAAGWVLETFRRLGHPELIDVLRIEWKSKFTARMGDATYRRPGYSRLNVLGSGVVGSVTEARIRFSSILWARASESERYQVAVHEVCHIVANHEAANQGRVTSSSHGHEWKALMRKCGLEPKRCHQVSRVGISSRRSMAASCACRVHAITANMASRILHGATLRCNKCRQSLKVLRSSGLAQVS